MWEERYRAGERGGREPSALLVRFVEGLEPGDALDLACGTGRNALWLASRGWNVIGLDSAPTAIEVARAAGVDARLFDLERGPIPFGEEFDLVCSIKYLYRPLFAEARRLLRPGGMFVGQFRQRPPFAIDEKELRALFAGWAILHVAHSEIVACRQATENNG